MNRTTRPKGPTPAIPSKIADRPRYVELTPDEERAFRQKLAEYEAAYHQTGDPLLGKRCATSSCPGRQCRIGWRTPFFASSIWP